MSSYIKQTCFLVRGEIGQSFDFDEIDRQLEQMNALEQSPVERFGAAPTAYNLRPTKSRLSRWMAAPQTVDPSKEELPKEEQEPETKRIRLEEETPTFSSFETTQLPSLTISEILEEVEPTVPDDPPPIICDACHDEIYPGLGCTCTPLYDDDDEDIQVVEITPLHSKNRVYGPK